MDIIEKFKALGDKTRFKLMKLLISNKDICVSELADEVHISVAGVSQQLKILEKAGLVERMRDGQKICYSVKPENKKILKLLESEQ